jgi:(p)ppGpp synthase/HD superfamily hydrolase
MKATGPPPIQPGVVALADEVAFYAHAGQKRRGTNEPYIEHPRRVRALAEQCGLGAYEQAAALLHDVIEDCGWTPAMLEAEEFPPRVIELVNLLSKWWGKDSNPKKLEDNKLRYYRRIAADPVAATLKLLDRADNMNDVLKVAALEPRWAREYLLKTKQEFDSIVSAAGGNQAACRVFGVALLALDNAVKK